MAGRKPAVPCGDCGTRYGALDHGAHIRRVRGLCSRCYARHRKTGSLIDFERSTRSSDEVLDEWELLRSEGLSRRQAAERMGMTFAALDRTIQRAERTADRHDTEHARSA